MRCSPALSRLQAPDGTGGCAIAQLIGIARVSNSLHRPQELVLLPRRLRERAMEQLLHNKNIQKSSKRVLGFCLLWPYIRPIQDSGLQAISHMNFRQVVNGVLLLALLTSGATLAGDNAIRVSDEQGTPIAQFKVGDSRCVLKDDQVHCVPISK